MSVNYGKHLLMMLNIVNISYQMKKNGNIYMKKKVIFSIVVTLLINLIIYTQRNKGFSYTQNLSYSVLYDTTVTGIKNWTEVNIYSDTVELELVRNIITDSMKVSPSDSSLIKIKKIANYILSKLNTCRGKPWAFMDSLSVYQQFNAARLGKSKIWCGNFARIFSLFANAASLPTRYIAEEGNPDNVHVFNECYCKEYKQWVFVDITAKIIAIPNSQKGFYTMSDLYFGILNATPPSTAIVWQNDSVTLTDFTSSKKFYTPYITAQSQPVFYYARQFNPNAYSFPNKIKRYISTCPIYAYYAAFTSKSNFRFYLKLFFFYLLIIEGVVLGLVWKKQG